MFGMINSSRPQQVSLLVDTDREIENLYCFSMGIPVGKHLKNYDFMVEF